MQLQAGCYLVTTATHEAREVWWSLHTNTHNSSLIPPSLNIGPMDWTHFKVPEHGILFHSKNKLLQGHTQRWVAMETRKALVHLRQVALKQHKILQVNHTQHTCPTALDTHTHVPI